MSETVTPTPETEPTLPTIPKNNSPEESERVISRVAVRVEPETSTESAGTPPTKTAGRDNKSSDAVAVSVIVSDEVACDDDAELLDDRLTEV